MRLLVRCKGKRGEKCFSWYNPEKHEVCPQCGLAWKFPARLYADFRYAKKRYRKRLAARDLPHALIEMENLDPGEAIRKKNEKPVKDLTLKEAVLQWIQHSRVEGLARNRTKRRPNRENTLKSKISSFENYWLPYLGPRTRLSMIDKKAIIQFKEQARFGERIKRLRAPASVNLDLRYWICFGNWAIREGYPLDRRSLDVGFLDVVQNESKLTDEQVETILTELEKSNMGEIQKDLFHLIMAHGGRAWSQCAAIEMGWVDFSTSSYTVPAHKDKGRHSVTIVLGDFGMSILARRWQAAKEAGTKYLFENPKTRKPFGPGCFRSFFRKLEREKGIKANPKRFRHLWCSTASLENASLAVRALGHSSSTVPITTYTHYEMMEQKKLSNMVEERIFKTVHNVDTMDRETLRKWQDHPAKNHATAQPS